ARGRGDEFANSHGLHHAGTSACRQSHLNDLLDRERCELRNTCESHSSGNFFRAFHNQARLLAIGRMTALSFQYATCDTGDMPSIRAPTETARASSTAAS